MSFRSSTPPIVALLLMLAVGAPALAGPSIAIGATLTTSPSNIGTAIMLSTDTAIPASPIQLQGTLFGLRSKRGGYAATLEVRGLTGGGFGGAYIGAGLGLGDLARDGSVGTVVTVFAGKSIGPMLSLELRGYQALRDSGSTVGFFGLRLSF